MDSKWKKKGFIDSDNSYTMSILMELSEDLPIEQFDLSLMSLDDSELIKWKLDNIRDIVSHYKRIKAVDLSKPILVRSDGVIIDGNHRVIKALAKGIRWLPSKTLTREQMKKAVEMEGEL